MNCARSHDDILTGLLIAGVWTAAGLAVLFHFARED